MGFCVCAQNATYAYVHSSYNFVIQPTNQHLLFRMVDDAVGIQFFFIYFQLKTFITLNVHSKQQSTNKHMLFPFYLQYYRWYH